jgi:hypothetical protein
MSTPEYDNNSKQWSATFSRQIFDLNCQSYDHAMSNIDLLVIMKSLDGTTTQYEAILPMHHPRISGSTVPIEE